MSVDRGVDPAHSEIFCAKDGKGGVIKCFLILYVIPVQPRPIRSYSDQHAHLD